MSVSEFIQEYIDVTKLLKKQSEKVIKDSFAHFFKKQPNVKLTWTQYTIYFNDGDACPFYLNEPDYEVNGDLGENFDEDFIEILKVFNLEEAFESFFGDHVKVIATKDGFDVQEYENHD